MSKLTALARALVAAPAYETPDLPRSLLIAREVRGSPASTEPAPVASPGSASPMRREPGGR